MSETDTTTVIRDGRLVNGGLHVSFILSELRDCGTIAETAKRCQCSDDEVKACLALASACVAKCTE